jgi:hypothetical protein
MNNKVNEMIKNMIDENVVDFKKNAANILYEKTGKKIEGMYETVAKNIIKTNTNETNN